MTFQEDLKNARGHVAGDWSVGREPNTCAFALVELADGVRHYLDADHPYVYSLTLRVLGAMLTKSFTKTITDAEIHVLDAYTVGGSPDPYASALVELAEQVAYLLKADHVAVENLCKRVLERMVLP